MAGWSILGNGGGLDYLEILQNLQNIGFCLDFDVSSLKMGNEVGKDNKLRDLFDQFLAGFLQEISVSESIRTLPAKLGDGTCIDLFRLFWVVREKGGYDSVSKCGLWGSVAEEVGLGYGVGSAVRLCYFKYLDPLDRWLRTYLAEKGKRGGKGVGKCGRNSRLETQFKGFLSSISDQSRINEEECGKLNSDKEDNQISSARGLHNTHEVIQVTKFEGIEKCVDNTHEAVCMTGLLDGVEKFMVNTNEVVDAIGLDSVEKCGVDDDEDVMVIDKNVVKQEVFTRKRKRGTLSGMLNWLTEVAKNPSDAAIGKLAEAYKEKGYGDKEFCTLALLARNALFPSQYMYWAEEKENHLLQKKQKMHPSMYEDQVGVDHHSMEILRCSQRILPSINGQLDPCHESSERDITANPPAGIENIQSLNPFEDDQTQKRVPIGTLFQAEIPEWTGVAIESDPKWLGTISWPLITGEQERNSVAKKAPIGKGRQDSCDCPLRDSVECVRFHIAEQRVKLRAELGLVFYTWRFNYMGEEVALSWTAAEETKFKDIVRQNPPSQNKWFWDQLRIRFRAKGWKNTVSYYFNVFVLQRRSYQNRVTPSNIDSDDDESEFGSLSKGFGHEAVNARGFKLIACAQNHQSTDLVGN